MQAKWLAGVIACALLLGGWLLSRVGKEPDGEERPSTVPSTVKAPKLPSKRTGSVSEGPFTTPAPPKATAPTAPSPRDLSVNEMTAWRGRLFNDDGTPNEEMFSKFGFTPEEREFFDDFWQKKMKLWQSIEKGSIRATTVADHGRTLDIDDFPEAGSSFRKGFIAEMDGKVPPSFARFFSELSHDDTTMMFADYGRSRQHYSLQEVDGGWTLVKDISRYSEEFNAWVITNTAKMSFNTIPERYAYLLEASK